MGGGVPRCEEGEEGYFQRWAGGEGQAGLGSSSYVELKKLKIF